MLSRFFIDRPVFANVIAIMTMIAGVVALRNLPVASFQSSRPPR
jgi:multidrug efflux pump subunit AcrB